METEGGDEAWETEGGDEAWDTERETEKRKRQNTITCQIFHSHPFPRQPQNTETAGTHRN